MHPAGSSLICAVSGALLFIAANFFADVPPLTAQEIPAPPPDTLQADTVVETPDDRRRARAAQRDPALVPPITPRRAFLYSLAIPGLGQTQLDRGRAGALFFLTEAVCIAMIRKSANDLRIARALPDSIIIGYLPDGTPVRTEPELRERIPARRTHVEDWIALLIFNHLFSGAEAFVAAHLWDLPATINVSSREGEIAVTAGFRW